MGRPKLRDTTAYSRMAGVRLRVDEDTGLKALGKALGLSPSRIIRRLIREAITGGPDYFDEDVKEIRLMHVHLAAVGRNLNQLVRAANRGEPILNEDVQRMVDVLRLQVAGIEDRYLTAVRAAAKRTWEPLYQEAGLPSPFDQTEATEAATGRPTRHPGRGPERAEREDADELEG